MHCFGAALVVLLSSSISISTETPSYTFVNGGKGCPTVLGSVGDEGRVQLLLFAIPFGHTKLGLKPR